MMQAGDEIALSYGKYADASVAASYKVLTEKHGWKIYYPTLTKRKYGLRLLPKSKRSGSQTRPPGVKCAKSGG